MSLRSESIEFGDYWPQIENIVLDVLNQRSVTPDLWQETFFDIYKVCVAPEGYVGKLYARLKDLIGNHVQGIYQAISTSDSQYLLTNYNAHWLRFRVGANYLDGLFNYINSQHLKKIKKPMNVEMYEDICKPGLEIKDLCLYIWQTKLIEPLKSQLLNLLLQSFEANRMGRIINQVVINGVVHSFAEVEEYTRDDALELYKNAFEKPFIIATAEYYRTEAERLRQELDCSGYMKKVLQIIDLETMTCTKFIHHSSKDIVISEIRARMVGDHSAYLYQESERIVNSDDWHDLNLMYRLLKPLDSGLKKLIQQVQERITHIGLEMLREIALSSNPPRAFVESFMMVHKIHSELIANTFNSDQLFTNALDKACATIINHKFNPPQPCRSPELLAKYCDSLLRKPGSTSSQGGSITKSLTESEIDEKLQQSITVFKYIEDKDIFQKFYSKHMAKRLILSQLASMEAEESMINKLKQVCGYEFTAKLQRMFTGIGVSNEQKEKFNVYLRQNNLNLGLNFSIYILQNGSWPLGQSPVTPFELPGVFARSVKSFEEYYYSSFSGRVLTWLYHHCTADLKLCFTKKQYLVTMQTFHAAILLLFEDSDELTYATISAKTQLSEDQLVKHLQGLLESKLLLTDDTSFNDSSRTQIKTEMPISMTSEPPTASKQMKRSDNGSPVNPVQYTFTPETKIRLNLDFSSRRIKFKIAVVQRDNQCQQAKDQTESELTHSSIDEDRKLYIQAAIVRVMKSRKVSKHNQLMNEVISLTKTHFSPSVAMIKKCIDILIEKQYLEKNTDSQFNDYDYKYLA